MNFLIKDYFIDIEKTDNKVFYFEIEIETFSIDSKIGIGFTMLENTN